MIPAKLFLRNFMSYGEPGEELAFDFHTACLCGDNGNGKSALLDALTWALWGRAPRLEGTQARTDEIIRRADGVNEALVEFQFDVDGERYRVVRRLRRNKGASVELHILTSPASASADEGVDTGDEERWKPLTGVTNTDTQRALQSLLGLDFHTFVNSSFLFQGRADSFTRAAPTERKEVLGRILRLDLYDELAKRARDLSRECEGRARQLGDESSRLQAQADCEPDLAHKAQDTEALLAQAETTIGECEAELEQARSRLNAADSAAQELGRVEVGLKQTAQQVDQLMRQEAEFRQRVERAKEALAEEGAVREAVAQLEQARQADEELTARREKAAQAESARQMAAAAIRAEQGRLEGELRQLEGLAREAQEAAGEAEALEKQAADVEGQIRACQDAEVALATAREEMQRLQTQRAANQEAVKALHGELEEVGGRVRALAEAAARCPLCRQELGEELRERLLSQAQWLASSREASAADLTRAGDETAALLAQVETKMRAIQPHVERIGGLRTQLGEVQQRRQHAAQAAARAEELAGQIAELRERISTGRFAEDDRSRLAEAEAAVAAAAYDSAEHKRVQETARSLAGSERKLGTVEAARESLPTDEQHLAQVADNLAAGLDALHAAEGERRQLKERAADAMPAEAALKQAESKRASAGKERDRLVAERAGMGAQIEACRRAREEAERCRGQRAEVERDRLLYAELAWAFGRQGVQALVVETVVPQLTEDANALLARMTEGRMRVEFVTQRERADGAAAETLDIHIGDEMGTRRYELYSGGEAFRVDFAVRVALARLLARRAGAKLQTLVVDEGFGTQDAPSRDRLVECINAIQDDFEKVIVITHIDELKDAFQDRIEVTKDDAGSHISRQVAAG